MKKTLRMNVFEKTYISPTCTIMNLEFEGTCLCTSPGKTSDIGHENYSFNNFTGVWDE